MAFDGSGTYNLPTPQYPAVAGTTILASNWNAILEDLQTALRLCLTRDGQAAATGNIPMGGKKFTGMADGAAATDSAAYGQLTTGLAGKQATLVSGTNIKTINGSSLLGAGNLTISPLTAVTRSARTANTILGAADQSDLIDVTSGTFTQTFEPCATLGDGWFCYYRNSGTGDITLDPNAAETIDGLASFVMYPGEARLIQCNGTALYSVVLTPFFRTFTASGTFTKPPGYSAFSVLAWSGGSSGQRNDNIVSQSVGGAGGGCFSTVFTAASVGTTETVTVGAGGAAVTTIANGNAGGNTTFGSLMTVYGGTSFSSGGATGYTQALANSGAAAYGFEGAGSNAFPFNAVYGGAAPGTNAAADSGNSIYGGAAGAGVDGSGNVRAAGTSKFGGSGGAASIAGNGTAGSAPGGGGGATQTGVQSGAGARGELRIWGVA